MRLIALTPAQQRRLEKLAREAGRAPRSMLRFVLRDGFEQCEEDVLRVKRAEADVRKRGTVTHAEAMRRVQGIIDSAHLSRASLVPATAGHSALSAAQTRP